MVVDFDVKGQCGAVFSTRGKGSSSYIIFIDISWPSVNCCFVVDLCLKQCYMTRWEHSNALLHVAGSQDFTWAQSYSICYYDALVCDIDACVYHFSICFDVLSRCNFIWFDMLFNFIMTRNLWCVPFYDCVFSEDPTLTLDQWLVIKSISNHKL